MAADDIRVPAPRDWDVAVAHAGMDDMADAAEQALFSRRLTVGELDAAALSVVHAALAPAEACTEIGAEPCRRERMGALRPWERRLLHAKAACWSLLGLGFIALLLWVAKP